MPNCLREEWTEYLNYELETITKAILSVVPSLGGLSGLDASSNNNTIKLTNPDDIAGLFDALGKKG